MSAAGVADPQGARRNAGRRHFGRRLHRPARGNRHSDPARTDRRHSGSKAQCGGCHDLPYPQRLRRASLIAPCLLSSSFDSRSANGARQRSKGRLATSFVPWRPLGRLPASRLRPPRSGLERSDFVPWPEAADPECPLFRRYRRESRRHAGTAKRAFLTHFRHGWSGAQTLIQLLYSISDIPWLRIVAIASFCRPVKCVASERAKFRKGWSIWRACMMRCPLAPDGIRKRRSDIRANRALLMDRAVLPIRRVGAIGCSDISRLFTWSSSSPIRSLRITTFSASAMTPLNNRTNLSDGTTLVVLTATVVWVRGKRRGSVVTFGRSTAGR
jgi:hypothetical protein